MWNDIAWCAATKGVEVQNDIGWCTTTKGVEVWKDKGSVSFLFFLGVHMNFDKVQFVYIDVDYMEYLNGIDSEVFFNKKDQNYRLKPHLGILLNNAGLKYV